MSDEMQVVNKMYDILYRCSCQHTLADFCGAVASEMGKVIHYDAASIMCVDVTGKIESFLLYGVEEKTWRRFMRFYQEGSPALSVDLTRPMDSFADHRVEIRDWTDESTQKTYPEFYLFHVQPLGLRYCLGFQLRDEKGFIRCIISYDRYQGKCFQENDVKTLMRMLPLLENIFIDLLLPRQDSFEENRLIRDDSSLTKREREVASLFCDGCDCQMIATRLRISVTTVYKHLNNIYKKLNISSHQELFAFYHKTMLPS